MRSGKLYLSRLGLPEPVALKQFNTLRTGCQFLDRVGSVLFIFKWTEDSNGGPSLLGQGQIPRSRVTWETRSIAST